MKRVHRGPTGKRVVVAAYCDCGHSRLSWRSASAAGRREGNRRGGSPVQRCVCGAVLKFGKPRMEHLTPEYRTRKARESKARAARRRAVMASRVHMPDADAERSILQTRLDPLGFGYLGG